MDFLVDTNVILRLAQSEHPMHATAQKGIDGLLDSGHNLCLMPQNIIEFWNVATRPTSNNGLGLSPAQADSDIAGLEAIFSVLPDSPEIFPEWRRLVVSHSVVGKQVHDTRLVAAMKVYGIDHLLTFNIRDFARFSDITLVDPATV